ncbi:MAG TPA: bifunctional nuclease family protein [Kofleriaceae bacterium]|nr:bifunctional nuclease family protein [Kofleriaceae bacterium]
MPVGDGASISMQVATLAVDPFTRLPVVILRDEAGEKRLPICIGLSEASAIAAELDDIELERPMTHQLMANTLAAVGARVARVEISDVEGNAFYAAVVLELASGEVVVEDARPSDALALALAVGAEIRVARQLIDSAERGDVRDHCRATRRGDATLVSAGESAESLDRLGDEAFGKWKM